MKKLSRTLKVSVVGIALCGLLYFGAIPLFGLSMRTAYPELSEYIGITMANLSILKTGKARAIRFETLDRLCAALGCQAADLLECKAGE